jgi:hypothetical protein
LRPVQAQAVFIRAAHAASFSFFSGSGTTSGATASSGWSVGRWPGDAWGIGITMTGHTNISGSSKNIDYWFKCDFKATWFWVLYCVEVQLFIQRNAKFFSTEQCVKSITMLYVFFDGRVYCMHIAPSWLMLIPWNGMDRPTVYAAWFLRQTHAFV